MKLRISGGVFRGRKIAAPKGATTRPTSDRLRQTVFDIIGAQIEGAYFLDAFAGSGAMAIEALSRGATSATLIERNRMAIEAIEANLKELELTSQATLYTADSIKAMKQLSSGSPFQIGYFDPPYPKSMKELSYFNEIFGQINQGGLFEAGALLFFEMPYETHQVNLDPYSALKLVKSRKVGNTCLHEVIYG